MNYTLFIRDIFMNNISISRVDFKFVCNCTKACKVLIFIERISIALNIC